MIFKGALRQSKAVIEPCLQHKSMIRQQIQNGNKKIIV